MLTKYSNIGLFFFFKCNEVSWMCTNNNYSNGVYHHHYYPNHLLCVWVRVLDFLLIDNQLARPLRRFFQMNSWISRIHEKPVMWSHSRSYHFHDWHSCKSQRIIHANKLQSDVNDERGSLNMSLSPSVFPHAFLSIELSLLNQTGRARI